ncbi:sensor histidine kinase KdpD [Massilia sp. Se16.2.3]|uniref:sensor histidine kinase n=1 Tax=Massilia sp. Se16.2.3 TaxID=2709303 RepID=UPI001601E6FA|nr:HAMP domain-containing sensor histidine kinase [Massilia sp. Se16.2.3]QNB00052.1 HAMP domain-containing histidine kinase [Massilia sp. Se16.2.3]
MAAAGPLLRRQLNGRRPDGTSFPLELAASMMTVGGERRLALLLLRDAAPAIEAAWRDRAAGERRHKTFQLASHELRTPLASIVGFSELLIKRDFDQASARELLEIVHAQAGLLSTVVTRVLDLARIEAGGRHLLRCAAEPIEGVLTRALGSVAPLGQNGRIRLELAPGLPPVAADAHRLQQAFANVLANSIAYSDPPTPITVSAWLDTGAVAVRVADAGRGMSLDERERLFEAFYRGPHAHGPGTGLGMAIFKEIIDLHGGSIEVESNPGRGTAVTVRLPLAGALHHG